MQKVCFFLFQGIRFLLPIIDKIAYVQYLKEQVIEIAHQQAITKGNSVILQYLCSVYDLQRRLLFVSDSSIFIFSIWKWKGSCFTVLCPVFFCQQQSIIAELSKCTFRTFRTRTKSTLAPLRLFNFRALCLTIAIHGNY